MTDELVKAHGQKARDVAIDTVNRHVQVSAWKQCAMWLQVVNRLSALPGRNVTT